MAIKLENGTVKIGDSIINSENNRLGVYESLYDLNINIRYSDDNSLETIPIKQCKKATTDIVINNLKEKSKEQLLCQLEQIKTALLEYDITVVTINKVLENPGTSKLETPAKEESFLDKKLREMKEKELENGDKKVI